MSIIKIDLEKVRAAIDVLSDGIYIRDIDHEVHIEGDVLVIKRKYTDEEYVIELPYAPVVAFMLLKKYVDAKDYYSMLAKKIETGVWE